MKLFGIKTCDSCRKALKSLEGAEIIDVRTTGVPDDLLARAYDRFGDAIVNSRSTTWRQLTEDQRQSNPIDLIKSTPTVMKRPLIDHDGTLYLGWGKDTQNALGVN